MHWTASFNCMWGNCLSGEYCELLTICIGMEMSLNDTPKGNRVHIALFGKRNAGKSSLINAITGQELSIVSDFKGTTTDPVFKAMELLPLGPVMVIDTPGLDDEGVLGRQRVQKAMEVLRKTDIAIVVVDSVSYQQAAEREELLKEELNILQLIKKRNIPFIVVYNKIDLLQERKMDIAERENAIIVSSKTKEGIEELKELLGKKMLYEEEKLQIVGDLLEPSDFVILVVPIDKAAPKGRLILPQQQTIRDILESDAVALVAKEYELRETLENLGKKPKMVITDSQVFAKVSADTPKDVWLTSFSILFARYKGNLESLVKSVKRIETLKDGDKILIAEGCTHHRQCDDIGTVKIPKWLLQHTGKKLIFETSSGNSFPDDLNEYAMVVHCGGCSLNRKEMQYRINFAQEQEIPIVNYGILIAYIQGILKRSLEPFPEIWMELED